MRNPLEYLRETPHLIINLGIAKLPYGAVSFSNGFMLGMALAYDVHLSTAETGIFLTSASILGGVRAAIGTATENTAASIIDYVGEEKQHPKNSKEWEKYHGLDEIINRSAKVGLRCQIEALLGYGAGYLYGRIGQ